MDKKSPDAFRTISEVSDWLKTPAHVLRFWESRFPQVKPMKRAGGRRYYRPSDMELLGGIKKLLHEDGMTIRGVQKILRAQGVKHVAAFSPALDENVPDEADQHDVTPPTSSTQPEKAVELEAPQSDPPKSPQQDAPSVTASEATPSQPKPEPSEQPSLSESEDMAPSKAIRVTNEREPEFSFDTPEEPLAPAPEPEPSNQIDMSSIPDVPANEDACFDPAPHIFPLQNPQMVRTKLVQDPAKAAVLYERLVSLASRMPTR